MSPLVSILPTGLANLASVRHAFLRLGCQVEELTTPASVVNAAALVLPGVGTYAAGVESLRKRALVEPLVERFRVRRPTLAICLGAQLLGEASEEAPGVAGLGVLPARWTAFPQRLCSPHMGWSEVSADPSDPTSASPTKPAMLCSGAAYFAHSYALSTLPVGWRGAWAQHGGPFVAALESGPLLACQFHPELSGSFGSALLQRFLRNAGLLPEASCSGHQEAT